MAEKKSNNLTDKADPTISTESVERGYPEGTHPLRPLSEQDWAAVNKEYADNPDKPDPSTVAQVEVVRDDLQPGK